VLTVAFVKCKSGLFKSFGILSFSHFTRNLDPGFKSQMFDDDDDVGQRQSLDATWCAMVVKAAEADAPGWAVTQTPSTSSTPATRWSRV